MAEYIEREALLADIDAAMQNSGMGYVVGQTLKRYVKRQATADVAPVVHGRWIQKDMFARYHWMHNCSVCGNPVYDKTKLYNYCPNCGARMDGADG